MASRTAASGYTRPQAQASAPLSDSVVDVKSVKRDNGCECLIGDCIDNFGRGEVLLTRTINGGLDNMSYGLGNFTWSWYFVVVT